MAHPASIPVWQRAIVAMSGAVVIAIVVTALYWVQAVFIPLALAVFLTFLLHPLVRGLQRIGVHRVISVILVIIFTSLVLAGIFWLVYVQVTELVAALPNYERNILDKARSLREAMGGNSSDRFVQLFDNLLRELGLSPSPTENPSPVVTQQTPGWVQGLPGYLGSAAGVLGGLALAIVLTIFMLFSREDLRNRFLRLVGHGQMPFATKAVDDAAHRVSRFLLMQAIVNGTYGIAVAVGLLLMHMEYALLWGFLAAVLRYVPYVGPWIAAVFPITLGLMTFEGWWQPLIIIVLFLVLELVSNNILEPMLYGQSMGVSEVALLIAAAFWAWLWGPVGLVLSAPLTVCLVVLGKYVPQMKFLDVLLGDDPPLKPDVTFYQRLLARDQDEAAGIVLAEVKKSEGEDVYERLLLPALSFVRHDRQRDDITPADEQFVLSAMREVLADLGEEGQPPVNATSADGTPLPLAASTAERVHIVACPARDAVDMVALEIFQRTLDLTRWAVEITAVETLSAEILDRVEADNPRLICIGAVAPGGLAHTRYLCKRLRSRFPEVKILVGRWGQKSDATEMHDQFCKAGADLVTTTLVETRIQMESLRQVLLESPAPPAVLRQKVGHEASARTASADMV